MTSMLSLYQAATLLGGKLLADGALPVQRISTDSRDIRPGDLFVALSGERFDGHQYVAAALAAGAVAAVVASGRTWPAGARLIEVGDPLLALGLLAAGWRNRFAVKVLAVTGSSGKTTVKDMLAAIATAAVGSDAVLATHGNLNNHIGVPLTLLQLTAAHRYAVVEMGMNHFGEIRYLTGLARPAVALVNNALAAHLEGLGSVAGVAQAKGEIFAGLPADGVAIVNGEDSFAARWRELCAGRAQLSFGGDGDIRAAAVQLAALGSQYQLQSPQGAIAIRLQTPGRHNVLNSLAAASAALAAGMSLSAIAEGLAAYQGTAGRLQQKRAINGALVLDDSYNANADSMKAAIDVLAALPEPRWLVLGDMGEVGADSARYHAEVGAYARDRGLQRVLALGPAMAAAVQAHGGAAARHYSALEPLLADLQAELPANGAVLVKGSRFMRMERVVAALTAIEQGNH